MHQERALGIGERGVDRACFNLLRLEHDANLPCIPAVHARAVLLERLNRIGDFPRVVGNDKRFIELIDGAETCATRARTVR